MDIKGEIDAETVIVGDFNIPLTSMDISSTQKMNKETEALIETLDQKDLIDSFRAFHPKAVQYTFFSSTQGTFSSTDHMLGHKTSLNEFKKIKIISNILSYHSGIKQESITRKKKLKSTQRHGG